MTETPNNNDTVGSESSSPTPTAAMPPTPPDRSGWPTGAKATVVFLAVIALLGAIGTIVGLTSGDDVADERDDLAEQVAELTTQYDEVVAERDELVEEVSAGEVAIEAVTAERDELAGEIDVLEAALETQQGLTAAVTAERDGLAALFPVEVDTSLVGVDLVGTYDAVYTETYCEGLESCEAAPSTTEVQIRETPEDWLELVMDGYVTTALFRVDGGLYAVTDSTTALSDCNGEPRLAHITITMYARGVEAAADGTTTVTSLGASFTTETPAVGDCPAGLAFYGAQLTPRG
jgi:hypothetical protein